MTKKCCVICGGPLPDQSHSRGRKRLYCSDACLKESWKGKTLGPGGKTQVDLDKELERRARDVRKDPALAACLRRLRSGGISPLPVQVKLNLLRFQREDRHA